MTGNRMPQRSNTPVFVPNILQSPDRKITLTVERYFEGLETLTPVRGTVRIVHKTSYLEVTGDAEAIGSLTCDRCLCQYNHRLKLEVSEPIWLQEDAAAAEADPEWLDQEIDQDDEIVETVSPQGHLDGEQWLYEQLCLSLPLRKLCRSDCEGIEVTEEQAGPALDARWAALAQLKPDDLN
jgi:uncharacterized protein